MNRITLDKRNIDEYIQKTDQKLITLAKKIQTHIVQVFKVYEHFEHRNYVRLKGGGERYNIANLNQIETDALNKTERYFRMKKYYDRNVIKEVLEQEYRLLK